MFWWPWGRQHAAAPAGELGEPPPNDGRHHRGGLPGAGGVQRRLVAMHLQQLSARAGHPINLTRIDRRRWMAASRAAQKADYQLLAAEIRRAMP